MTFFSYLLKQRPVVHHRLSQIFRAGFAGAMAKSDSMRGSVVFHHDRIVDGNISCALVKIANRIPASLHHFAHQGIRHGYSSPRIVDKLALDFIPTSAET